jgi:hypothetical protein
MKIRRHPSTNVEDYSITDNRKISEVLAEVKPGITDYLSISIDAEQRKSLLSIEFERDDLFYLSQGFLDHYKLLVEKYEKEISEIVAIFDILSHLDTGSSHYKLWRTLIAEKHNNFKIDKNIQNIEINKFEFIRNKFDLINYKDGISLLKGIFFQSKNRENTLVSILQKNLLLKDLIRIEVEMEEIQGEFYQCDPGIYSLINSSQEEYKEYFFDIFFDMIDDHQLYRMPFIINNIPKEVLSFDELFVVIVKFVLSLPDEADAFYDLNFNDDEY